MNKKIQALSGNQSGMALLITLGVIAVLMTLTFELNRRVKIASLASETGKIDHTLMLMAESALETGQAILVKDALETRTDSIQEGWSDPKYLDKILTGLNLGPGQVTLRISDEMGKIQINALIREYPGNQVNVDQRKIWENLLSLLISRDKSIDQQNPDEILNSLIDWLDSKDDSAVTGLSGAESGYYNSLDPPYSCADKYISELSQLYLIKGVSKDLMSIGKSPLGELFNLPGQDDSDESKEIRLALSDLFTIFGAERETLGPDRANPKTYRFPGKININTAPLPVIAALLPSGKQDLAPLIHRYRTEKSGPAGDYIYNLGRKGWLADIPGLARHELAEIKKKITYASQYFSMEALARLGNRSLVLKRVVVRLRDKKGRWGCKILRQVRN